MAAGSKPNTYVTTIDISRAQHLHDELSTQNFSFTKPPHTVFCAKKQGISCTLYNSGKLVVQGKDKDEFIEFFLEPVFLKEFTYNYGNTNSDNTLRIGIDESGKGDFFGPLCIAGVCAGGEDIEKLHSIGVRDSKAMNDKTILALGKKIRAEFPFYVVKITPKKYNELYAKFNNLNRLLAWGHATTIENLVKSTSCSNVIIDQFASEDVVINALSSKNVEVDLTQRHRGEEDIVVAAASILAREAFILGIADLSERYSIPLHKGANAKVIQAGKALVRQFGRDALSDVAKLHFKTLDAIIS